MENIKSDKIERVLGIYTKLMNGYIVSKAEEAVNYGVNERSIQRDIDPSPINWTQLSRTFVDYRRIAL